MSIEELRRRVHAAADRVEVPPPPTDLLAGEVRRLPGRRRGLGLALAAAAAVLAVVGVTAVVLDRGDGGRDPQVAAGHEKATAGALLAVALEHAGVEPASLEAISEADLRYGRGTVGGDLRFAPGEGYDGDLLRVVAGPGRLPQDLCADAVCDRRRTDLGELVVAWEFALPEEDPGTVTVALQGQGEWRLAHYAGVTIDGDPRELRRLPVSVAQMTAIVTDPRFGLRTTPEALAAGAALDVAGDNGGPEVGGGALDAWTPRVMAGFVQQELGNVRSARPSTYDEPAGPTGEAEGIHAELTVGTQFELLLVTEPGSRPLACPAGYRCFRGDGGVVYAWTPRGSDLAVLRDRGDFTVRLWIHDPAFHVRSREDFLDNVLVALADLTAHPALAPRMRADHAEEPVSGWTE